MNNYYGTPLSQEELQRQLAPQRRNFQGQRNRMRMVNTSVAGNQGQGNQHGNPMSSMSDMHVSSGDTLNDIINQSTRDIQRRRSASQTFTAAMSPTDANRRLSMMSYNNGNDAFRGYSFNDDVGAGYGNMSPGMGDSMAIHTSGATYGQSSMMEMTNPNNFSTLSSEMIGDIMTFSNLNVGQMQNSMDMFQSSGMGSQYGNGIDSVHDDYAMDMGVDSGSLSTATTGPPNSAGLKNNDDDMMTVDQAYGDNQSRNAQQSQNTNGGANPNHQNLPNFTSNFPPAIQQEIANSAPFQSPASSTSRTLAHPNSSGQNLPTPTTSSATPATTTTATPGAGGGAGGEVKEKDKTVYSKSGFDMLRALWYVATRKNPRVSLGAVDMSCAFVVCDVCLNDCPIIYVSDNFQNLTGYNRHEIVGQNCRFLQAPDGKVEAGTKREFVANEAVYNLKQKIAEGAEVQQSLINYRKGGKPFLNLLTMIPIPWDNPNEIRYIIGFQIDLVECPDAISKNEGGGSVQVNYVHSDIGQYIWTAPPASHWEPEGGQTLGIDDVSTLLQQFNPTGVVSDWHKQSWDKMLLENTDDVVHVLSLKGLFLYLSPACKKVLEYDASDLVGTALSEICHPSDIVPVTRELKDTASGSPVNIVFRIRRKQSGYTWFESHGSLFAEVGKGRKCIILVGRKRPVFALRRRDLEAQGGIGDSEFWTKISTSGMFLFVSSNVRSLLDLHPETLMGTSMQDLMRKESRPEFGRAIEKARRGKTVTCKHEVQNKRGQVLQAQTTMYPGDASEGEKPTFLLAQTKLLKASSRSATHNQGHGSSASASRSVGGGSNASMPSDEIGSSSGQVSRSPVGRSSTDGGTGLVSQAGGGHLHLGSQDVALAADDNIFEELKTTRATSWQYELRQMEKVNRLLAEELAQILSHRKRRKRRKGSGNVARDCANCHTRNTPEWRRGPSGNRDLCNSCGLRWAKQVCRRHAPTPPLHLHSPCSPSPYRCPVLL